MVELPVASIIVFLVAGYLLGFLVGFGIRKKCNGLHDTSSNR